MGLTAVDDQRAHIDRIIDGFSDSLKQLGHHPVG
jgi:hypothetical protein